MSYRVSIDSTVIFKIKQLRSGRRVKGRCVAPTRTNRRRPRCTRLVALRGELALSGVAGANRFTFNGRIGGHGLGPGSYRLTGKPSAASASGRAHSVTFRIVR